MNIIYRMFVHDLLYVMADQLIKKYNPCQIHTSRSGLVTCLGDNGPCCNNCEYISNSGCTVTCLGCKLGLCSTAREHHTELGHKLWDMAKLSNIHEIRTIRTSRRWEYESLKRSRDHEKRLTTMRGKYIN